MPTIKQAGPTIKDTCWELQTCQPEQMEPYSKTFLDIKTYTSVCMHAVKPKNTHCMVMPIFCEYLSLHS